MAQFVGTSAPGVETASDTVSATPHASTASGHDLIAYVASDATGDITPVESGWTEVLNVGGSGSQVAIFVRRLTAAPAASYGFTCAAATNNEVLIDTVDPEGAAAPTVTFSTVVASAPPTATSNALTGAADETYYGFCAVNDANSAIVTPPSGLTESDHADNASHELYVAHRVNGNTGSLQHSIEWSTATNKLTTSVLLAYAAAGGSATVEPGAGALTATGQAPVVLTPRVMRPAAGAVSATGFAPTVLTPRTIAAGVGTVTVTGFAPTVLTGTTVAPATGAVSVTGFAPTIVTPQSVAPGAGTVTATGFAPVVLTPRVVQPATGTATVTGFAPSVVLPRTVRPATGAATLTGYAPTVAVGGNALVRAQLASLLFAGYAPTVEVAGTSTATGKYAREHADAFAALGSATGFSREHADAFRSLGDA